MHLHSTGLKGPWYISSFSLCAHSFAYTCSSGHRGSFSLLLRAILKLGFVSDEVPNSSSTRAGHPMEKPALLNAQGIIRIDFQAA